MLWFLDRIMQRCVAHKGSSEVKREITDDMRASAEVSAAQWNDYQTRFAPFEQKFMDDVTRDTGNTLDSVQGRTNADVQQKMATQSSPQAGLDPSRGSTLSTSATGKGLAAGFVAGQKGVEDMQTQNLATVVGMGRGQAVDAVGTMSDLAVSSGQTALNRQISDATESMNERGATMQLIGQGLGAAGAVGSNYMQSTGGVSSALQKQPEGTMTKVSGDVYQGNSGDHYTLTSKGRWIPTKL